MLRQRVLTAIVGILALIVIVFLLPPALALGCYTVAILFAAWEWSALVRLDGHLARIAYVVENCPLPMHSDSTTARGDRVLFPWHDLNGAPLEVIAVEESDGNLVVLHAMRKRRSFESRLLEVLGSQKP